VKGNSRLLSPASVWDWSSNLGKDGLWRHRLLARRIGQRVLLLPCAWKSLMRVVWLVFPFSLLWPTLLTCSGRASVTATLDIVIRVQLLVTPVYLLSSYCYSAYCRLSRRTESKPQRFIVILYTSIISIHLYHAWAQLRHQE